MFSKLFSRQDAVLKLTMRQLLFISCSFSCGLVCVRIIVTDSPAFLFLVWNLFLAFVPYVISEWLSRHVAIIEHTWKRWAVLAVWLVFIPNAFYIITDLFHLERFDTAPKWFDLLLLFSFAWNGLLFGMLSVRKIELILAVVHGRGFSLFLVLTVMWLNAFGIYIGRYLRYNSWDIIMQPFSLFNELIQVLIHPFQNSMEWGMITTWAVFMTLFYLTIRKLGESFLAQQYRSGK
jgi:uncharacterized membrane protein